MRRNFVLASLFLALSTSFAPGQVREEWVARYSGPGDSGNGAWVIALDADGNVYVTGRSEGVGTRADYATVKYDPAGNQLWVARYNGPGNHDDAATAMALDAEGNVYVTGWSVGMGTNYDYATIKYDPNGQELWVARYDGPAHDEDIATGIALDAKGNVYVTGRSCALVRPPDCIFDYATVKYDPEGNELWVARYHDLGDRPARAYGIALDAEGNAYVTGSSATIKYDADGNELWVARHDDPLYGINLRALAIAVDARGNPHVTGQRQGDCGAAFFCYGTIKYNSEGNQLWVARYSSPGRTSSFAWAIALDASGNVYVTGASQGVGTGYDYATVKYDTDGHQLWVARYDNGRGDNQATAIAVDGDGDVYVTGRSLGVGSTNYNYATVKYDSDGNQLWVARYKGPVNGNDVAWAIALDVKANVYVTGESCDRRDPRSCLGSSYATIKYAQE